MGLWHNQLLEKYAELEYFPPYSCGTDYLIHIDSMMKEIVDTYYSSTNVYDYLELDSSYSAANATDYVFACNESAGNLSQYLVIALKAQIDTFSVLSSGEKTLIKDALDYGISGFSSQTEKEDLIDDWTALSGKFLDGYMSGGIITMVLYSDCFWDSYQSSRGSVNPRWINIAIADLAGAGLSFIKDGVQGAGNGNNNDPQAGITYLKRAGMNGLRASAGPLGVLF